MSTDERTEKMEGQLARLRWDSGLKRITLVLAMLGAIIVAGWFFSDSARRLSDTESSLARAQSRDAFSDWDLRRIEELAERVRELHIEVPVATVGCGLLGFVGVWAVYAAGKWGACPTCKWIVKGFKADVPKRKDEPEQKE